MLTEKSLYKKESDGWFTYYRCICCGKKIQLTTDATPLPKQCPNCHATTDKMK